MAASPEDCVLFFSSSPTRCAISPSEEVESHLAQARSVNRLDPAIEAFVTSHHHAFLETFSRQIELIRSRSQIFEDCRVTIFDKVLLELTEHGNHLDHPAAIQYFCDEFLAIPRDGSTAQQHSALTNTLIASNSMTHDEYPPAVPQVLTSNEDIAGVISQTPQRKTLFGHKLDKSSSLSSGDLAALAASIGPSMARLWTVYLAAKREFVDIADPDSDPKRAAARFLRDTAENTLGHIRDKGADQRLADEVEETLEDTEQIVTAMCGGKKRKFDQPSTTHNSNGRAQSRTVHTNPTNERYSGRISEQTSSVRGSNSQQLFTGHARALACHRKPHLSEEDSRDRAPTELFPQESNIPWKKRQGRSKAQPGRGHSGIPFGYSRPVDSYRPER